MAQSVDAVLFDKDGTLLDGERTWAGAAAEALSQIDPPRPALEAVCAALGLRLGTFPTLAAGAPLLWMSNPQLAAMVAPHMDGDTFVSLVCERTLDRLHPADGAEETVLGLRDRGVPVGVVTNDSVANTHRQFGALGWDGLFDAVIGHDSGYPAKPDPGMIIAAARLLEARRPAFVGDSDVDVAAALAAGAYAVFISPRGCGHDAANASIRTLADLLDGDLLTLAGVRR